MKEFTLKEIKKLVSLGLAEDLTQASHEEIKSKISKMKRFEKLGYSSGVYGINGGLFWDAQNGDIYAITARNSNLFMIF